MPLILELELEKQTISDVFKKMKLTDKTGTEDCCICMEKTINEIKVGCCGKSYCSKCLLTWYSTNPTCPTCRSLNIT